MQKILQKPDLRGRISSWFIELLEFNIQYEVRGPIKDNVWSTLPLTYKENIFSKKNGGPYT